MSYTPKTWENKPSTASPINATNLNHMEGGIKTNDDNIIGAQNAILTLQGEMLQAQGDISALETLVDSMLPVDSESGNPAAITDAFGGACKSLKLTLEPIQASGTPSPSNPLPISGRTQAKITRCGKNLVSQINVGAWLGTTGNFSTSYLQFSGSEKIKVNPSGMYTLSCTASSFSGPAHALLFYDKNKEYLGQALVVDFSSFPKTFTVPDSAYYCTFDVNAQKSNITSIQLESGSTATPYEPYNGESITIQLGQTVYGGVLDVTSGVLTITYALIDLGDLTWGKSSTGNRFYTNLSTPYKWSDSLVMYCSAYAFDGVGNSNRGYYGADKTFRYYWLGSGNLSYELYIANEDYSSAEAFAISVVGYKLCYELATPTTVQLTAEEVTLLKGDNVLTTDADSIEASYSADIALYIEKKIAEGSQGNRSLSKGGLGDEEVKEEVKEEEIEMKEEPLTKEVR